MELFAADGHDAGGCERVTGKSGMRPYPPARQPRSSLGPARIAHSRGAHFGVFGTTAPFALPCSRVALLEARHVRVVLFLNETGRVGTDSIPMWRPAPRRPAQRSHWRADGHCFRRGAPPPDPQNRPPRIASVGRYRCRRTLVPCGPLPGGPTRGWGRPSPRTAPRVLLP